MGREVFFSMPASNSPLTQKAYLPQPVSSYLNKYLIPLHQEETPTGKPPMWTLRAFQTQLQ